jgi:hypothetical protein
LVSITALNLSALNCSNGAISPYPAFVHDDVKTFKCGHRHPHGGLSGAFVCHVKRNRANAIAVFFYQVIQSSRVPRGGD